MKLKLIALTATALAVGFSAWFGGWSITLGAQAVKPTLDERVHAIANSYFRMGQQAALMARDISENRARAVRKRYGYTECDNGSYTNREDFEIVTERVDCIDHPRIWEIFRKLNDGSVLGLDTNSQCQWTNNKPWTVLTR